MKVKCAIVGCGQIAGSYDTPEGDSVRTHAKAILNNPHFWKAYEILYCINGRAFLSTSFF